MNSAIHTSTAEQGTVGRIYNSIRLYFSNIAFYNLNNVQVLYCKMVCRLF